MENLIVVVCINFFLTVVLCIDFAYRYGFDKGRPEDEPTQEELKEFEEWCNKSIKKKGC